MKTSLSITIGVLLNLLVVAAPAVLGAEKNTLGVAPVEPTPALAASVVKQGKANQMDQVLQSLDEQLVDRLHETRKFELVSRGDLKVVLTEQEFANSGNVDANDKKAAKQFQLAGAQYVVATKVDGFKDFSEESTVAETGERITVRILSVSAVAKIYNPTTGILRESTNFQIRKQQRLLSLKRGNENAALSDELLVGVARDMADKIANRVVEVLYPAKIVSKLPDHVTINRGDGTGVAVGQRWDVFMPGDAITDPDTGEVLGVEEKYAGQVEITSVLPKVSTATIMEDKAGKIAAGGILRRSTTSQPQPPASN